MEPIDVFDALDLIPHPLVIVTAGDPQKPGRRGGMAAAWVSRVSWDPPLIAISMSPERFTYQLIKEFKAFAIHLVSKELEDIAMNVFGSPSGRSVDKFAKAGIEPLKAQAVTAPIIPQSPLVIECKLVAEYPAGDHVTVVGEAVKAYKTSTKPLLIWHESKAKTI